MLPNSYTLSSPPPTLTRPHCPRRFRNKSGRTRHIQVAHHLSEGSDSHGPNTAAHTSPVPSLESSFHNQSPVPLASRHLHHMMVSTMPTLITSIWILIIPIPMLFAPHLFHLRHLFLHVTDPMPTLTLTWKSSLTLHGFFILNLIVCQFFFNIFIVINVSICRGDL